MEEVQGLYSVRNVSYYFAGSQRVAIPALHRRRLRAVHVCARAAACTTSSLITPPSAPPLRGYGVGSTALAANGTTGALISEQRYKPWGEQRYPAGASPLPTRHRFTGQIEDSEIGLYFYGARYYSSVLGRFLSADTIVPNPSDPQQLNRYAYTRNNPLKFVDPSGHRFDCSYELETTTCPTYYAGYSVLDRRPWVQAYITEKMDPIHFLDPIGAWITGGFLGGVVGDVVGQVPYFSPLSPPVMPGPNESFMNPADAMGDHDCAGCGYQRNATANATATELGTKSATVNRIAKPEWVRDGGSFVNWMKNLQKEFQVGRSSLTISEADDIVKMARGYGVSVRYTPDDAVGHAGTPWDMPHLNIGDSANAHIPVQPGYQLPP